MMKLPFKVDLKDKVAAVTGGGGILCSGMAATLAACGARVAVLDLRKEAADKAAEEIRQAGGEAAGFACNVLEKESIENCRDEVEKSLGAVDILVNGAGGNHPKGTTTNERLTIEDLARNDPGFISFFDLDPSGIQFVFNLNFIGTLLPTQIFSRGMATRQHGTIINISSMNAFKPLTKIPAYSGAKAAVSNFTQWLAVHLAPVNVRVNAIAPGFFLTDQNRTLMTQADGSLTPRGERIMAHTPMGRFGEPSDLNGALLWLVSDEASGFVTGTVIAIDGGFSAFSGV